MGVAGGERQREETVSRMAAATMGGGTGGGSAGDTGGGSGGGSVRAGVPGRVQALRDEVSGVTSIMSHNLEQILARGENLERLQSKSQDLEATSEQFRTTSQRVARRFWWQNVRVLVGLGVLGTILLLLVILLATGVIPT